jgi:tetratricopeptide (TPR) repeat protein
MKWPVIIARMAKKGIRILIVRQTRPQDGNGFRRSLFGLVCLVAFTSCSKNQISEAAEVRKKLAMAVEAQDRERAYELATEFLEKHGELNPVWRISAIKDRGWARMPKDPRGAIADLTKAIDFLKETTDEVCPERIAWLGKSLYFRGGCYAVQNDYHAAQRDFAESLEYDPSNDEAAKFHDLLQWKTGKSYRK